MEVTYRKNLGGSYMCVKEEGEIAQKYELYMLEGHQIPGLLRLQTSVAEGRRRYLYDISRKQQIGDYLCGKKIGYQLLQTVLFSIQKVCASVTEYLLREEGICLEIEFIYVNLEDGSLQFTYLPFYQKNLAQAFVECMEQLLRQIDHRDQAAAELGYQVYQLSIQDNANIKNILETAMQNKMFFDKDYGRQSEALKTELQQNRNRSQLQDVQAETGNVEHVEVSVKKRGRLSEKFCNWYLENRENWTKKKADKNRKKEFLLASFLENKIFVWRGLIQNMIQKEGGEIDKAQTGTILKGRSGQLFSKKSVSQHDKKGHNKRKDAQRLKQAINQETENDQKNSDENENVLRPTEILSAPADKPLGRLIYQGIHQCEDFTVKGEIFLIGKNGAQVDGVIQSEGVSRLHAKIYTKEGQFYLEDLNSTNGTYLNEVALEYHQPRPLSRGDRVRFGAEEYLFS